MDENRHSNHRRILILLKTKFIYVESVEEQKIHLKRLQIFVKQKTDKIFRNLNAQTIRDRKIKKRDISQN